MELNDKLDVFIIGAGGAGCSAAIEAWRITKNILMVSKSDLKDSKTARAQGGIQAPFHENDSIENHLNDTLNAGNNKNDLELVEILTSNAKDTVKWLESLNVSFDLNTEGSYHLKKAAGISYPRVLSCGDESGNRIITPVLNYVESKGIPIRTKVNVRSIQKVSDYFEVSCQFNNKSKKILAKSIVLATGGLLSHEKMVGLGKDVKSNPDGVDLAVMIGAKVVTPERMQYHPTGVIEPSSLRRQRLPETMRGCGARLLDKNMNVFTDPLLTRNQLSDRIVEVCENGNGIRTQDNYVGVYMTTPDIDKINGIGYTKQHFNKFYKMFMEKGHDLTKKPVIVYPIVHYSLGGVKIDANAESTIKGLFAAGETAYGVHGEDRLMGNSLLDIFVFGRIAGRQAALAAQEKI